MAATWIPHYSGLPQQRASRRLHGAAMPVVRRGSALNERPFFDAFGQHGLANKASDKGEDFTAFDSKGGTSAFGLFDGHGGKYCANICAELAGQGLLPRLLELNPASKEAIVDTFWAADAEIGRTLCSQGHEKAGSTATVLLVRSQGGETGAAVNAATPGSSGMFGGAGAGGALECTLAWVGDSTALAVDMSSGKRVLKSYNHSASKADEAAQLKRLGEVDKAIGRIRGRRKSMVTAMDDEEVDDDPRQSEGGISASEVAAAMKEVNPDEEPSAADVALCHRALNRERHVRRLLPKGARKRRTAHVQRRPAKKDANQPWVVATDPDPYAHAYNDLQMTRSICDYTKCVWVLPHPQIEHFVVQASQHHRVVIASDGLWDVVSSIDACKIVRDEATAQQAAAALVEAARAVYLSRAGHSGSKMGDDTTVMVIDLNPSGREWLPEASGGCSAACVLL